MKPQTVGILGGGQLAQMLAEAAPRISVVAIPFCKSASEPAAQIAPKHFLGNEENIDALSKFFEQIEILIFENEFSRFDCVAEALKRRNVTCQPSLATMIELSDKSKQKERLKALSLRTADFLSLRSISELDSWIEQVRRKFPKGSVFKWGERGYDGKGILLADSSTQAETIKNFSSQALECGYAVYAEERINFKQELAIIGCRSRSGEFISYPLVCSEQKQGICSLVTGPAVALGVPELLEQQAKEIAKILALELNIVGCFGIEFFQTQDGDLLVNEIAPRVHNSGHYSQEACTTSQFENHLRAVLGMELGSVEHRPAFAMLNLLGPEGIKGEIKPEALPQTSGQLALHWYGKSSISPRRKVGHLNGTVDNINKLPALCAELKACEAEWIKRLQGIYGR